MAEVSQTAAALRKQRYVERKAAEKAQWRWTARGYECPDCRVLGPHPVYRFYGGVLEVECGSDWCGREFFIDWRPRP